jgi:KaiC/GvpD/RAD55 family RecA-like ATPase
MRPTDVFIPDGYPSETYVPQQGGKFERQLDEALAQRGKIISIVGASKTGKTTLCARRFGKSQVVIPGSRLGAAEDVWIQAFEQAGGRITGSVRANPMDNAIHLLKREKNVLVLDDFHYVDRELQRGISRQIKSVAYEGVTVVVVSLPHRDDDPVRSNPDLAGRVYSIDLGFWTPEDLKKIGEVGFPKVGARVEPAVLDWLAAEALTSPQIMHTLCLETCRDMGIVGQGPVRAVAERDVNRRSVVDRAARSYVNNTAILKLRQGPLRRGPERKVFGFVNEGRGDVYELLVRTIARDPPQLRFSYEEIRERAGALAPGERPDLLAALGQWNDLFTDADYRPVEWDAEQRQLNILDPHLFFWIRYTLRNGPAPAASTG